MVVVLNWRLFVVLLCSPKLSRFHSAEPLKLSDVPLYLRSGDLYKSFVTTADSEDEEAGDTENEIPGVPLDCRKVNTSISNVDDLDKLIKTLRYWLVTDLPAELISYCLTHDDAWIGFTLFHYSSDFPYLADLCAVWGTVTRRQEDNDDEAELEDYIISCSGANSRNTRYIIAAERGRLEIVKFLLGRTQILSAATFDANVTCQMAAAAAAGGHIHCLQFLAERKSKWGSEAVSAAAKNGHLECLRFLHQQGCPMPHTQSLLQDAVSGGDLGCVQYVHQLGGEWHEMLIYTAARLGHVDILQYALDHGCAWWPNTTMVLASGGHIEGLRHAQRHNWAWHSATCDAAAENGHLSCLQFAHECGCALTVNLISKAAQRGHLSCIVYAVEQGCPWCTETTNIFAAKGNLAGLELAHQRGWEWHPSTCDTAAASGNLACLRFLHEQCGLALTASTYKTAERTRCCSYLREQGCPGAVETSIIVGSVAELKHALQHGCP